MEKQTCDKEWELEPKSNKCERGKKILMIYIIRDNGLSFLFSSFHIMQRVCQLRCLGFY